MEEEEDMEFGLYDGLCQACDAYTRVNDISLCEECDGKFDRDLIRKRDWDYSASAFGCPADRLEELRKHVIMEYGEALELLAEDRPRGKRGAKPGKTKPKREAPTRKG